MSNYLALKAAAYQLAAEKGYSEAISALSTIASELQQAQWDGR